MGMVIATRKLFKQQKDLVSWLTNNIKLRDELEKLFQKHHMYAYFAKSSGGIWIDDM